MATRIGKRPMRVVSAQEKLDAIRRVHDGESKASVARDIGVPESTLRGWCKNEEKISRQSRQSSPETDESLEPQIKKSRVEDSIQPFNLSLKSNVSTSFSSNSDRSYVATDSCVKAADPDAIRAAPINLNAKQAKPEVPRSNYLTERERNRAKLARMSDELGLNKPEIFISNLQSQQSLADFTSNVNLLIWQARAYQQYQQNLQGISKNKVNTPADASSQYFTRLLSMVEQEEIKHLLKNQPPLDEVVIRKLKNQQNISSSRQNTLQHANEATTSAKSLGTSSTPVTSRRMNGNTQNQPVSRFYNGNGCNQTAPPQCSPEKPILYQQLTMETAQKEASAVPDQQNAENLTVGDKSTRSNNNNTNRVRSVLDNLLFNDMNNVANNNRKEESTDDEAVEALEHGEMFMKFLETCSYPLVTATQIMQYRTLLNNVRSGAARANNIRIKPN